MSDEYVNVPLEKEDDEHPELDARHGVLIDINDPSLTEEVLHENAEADAYAERATLKVTSDLQFPYSFSDRLTRQDNPKPHFLHIQFH
jgi:hypothetical protein